MALVPSLEASENTYLRWQAPFRGFDRPGFAAK